MKKFAAFLIITMIFGTGIFALSNVFSAESLPSEENNSFYYEFFLDSLFIAIIRWITDKDCEPPEQFLTHLLSYIISFSKHILEIYSDSERANHTET